MGGGGTANRNPPPASDSTEPQWRSVAMTLIRRHAELGPHVLCARRREGEKLGRGGLHAEWGACCVHHPREDASLLLLSAFSWSATRAEGPEGMHLGGQVPGIKGPGQGSETDLRAEPVCRALPLPPARRDFRERRVFWAQSVPHMASQEAMVRAAPNPK